MFGLHDGIYFTIYMIYWCLMGINGVWNRMVFNTGAQTPGLPEQSGDLSFHATGQDAITLDS